MMKRENAATRKALSLIQMTEMLLDAFCEMDPDVHFEDEFLEIIAQLSENVARQRQPKTIGDLRRLYSAPSVGWPVVEAGFQFLLEAAAAGDWYELAIIENTWVATGALEHLPSEAGAAEIMAWIDRCLPPEKFAGPPPALLMPIEGPVQ